jgi:hypothetical protein
MYNRLLNLSERSTHDRLQNVCAPLGACVFPKIRLADVLPINNSGISDEQFTFALRAHFDFTVADGRYFPLFVVEFDGESHDDPGQQVRDRMKDALCARFGLPLLRIGEKYLDPQFAKMDLLTWFAQVKSAFPLWLSRSVQGKLARRFAEGKVFDFGTSHVGGCDAAGVSRAVAWILVSEQTGVVSRASIRGQNFSDWCHAAAEEIALHRLGEKVESVLAGESEATPREAMASEIETFCQVHRVRSALLMGKLRVELRPK